MTGKTRNTLLGQTPMTYGLTSLAAVCLAGLSWPLIVVVGFLVVVLVVPLVLIAVVSGLMGVAASLYHRDFFAGIAAILGLALVGIGLWGLSDAMNF